MLLYDQVRQSDQDSNRRPPSIHATCVVLECCRQEWCDWLLFGVWLAVLLVLLLLLLLRVVARVVVLLYDFPGLFCVKVNVNASSPAAVILIVIVNAAHCSRAGATHNPTLGPGSARV